MNFLESDINYSILEKFNEGNKRDIVISFFNNKRKSKIRSKYSYYLRLYPESDIKNEEEDLNTLAITSSSKFKYYESIGNSYKKKVNFTLEGLLNDERYQCYLFIKRNNSEGEEYKVQKFTIEKKKDKDNRLLLLILILLLLIIIIILVFSIYLKRIGRKNKELEERVRNISFKDDDDDSLDEDMNPKVNFV